MDGVLPGVSSELSEGALERTRTWEEVGVVPLRDMKCPKIQDKGLTCMFLGYSLEHAGNCYRMYNPSTGKLHISRDVKWSNRMYLKNVRFLLISTYPRGVKTTFSLMSDSFSWDSITS